MKLGPLCGYLALQCVQPREAANDIPREPPCRLCVAIPTISTYIGSHNLFGNYPTRALAPGNSRVESPPPIVYVSSLGFIMKNSNCVGWLLVTCLLPIACSGTSSGNSGSGGNGAAGGLGVAGNNAGGSGASTNSGGSTASGGGADSCGNAKGQLFPPGSIWNTAVDTAALDAESATVISYLQTNHTAGARFQIDFSIKVLSANASTPHQIFTQTGDFYSPDCDPAPIPVPSGGSLEGETGYACTGDGDCHLLVVDSSTCRLHEMWRANFVGSNYQGGCQVIWDLTKVYPANMRGDYCTSADAAGLPISAHLFSADELQAGAINHAIRFILPNSLMRANMYVHPATHSTGATSGPASSPPYGAWLRLKASKDISGLTAGAQIVAKGLKKYGMILSDGGNITFTATADDYTTAKWSQVNLTAQDLKPLQWSDFEMIDGGTRINWQAGDCPHVPITQ